jgi:hypothetical protein
MREIKFRAWDEKANKYLYFTLFNIPNYHKDFCRLMLDGVDFEQFTGLHDKNGKEDWINDIAETYVGNIKYRRRIFQSEISGAYCINLPTLGSTSGEEAIMLCTCEHTNIGNIHSTPELMESDNG